MQFDYKNTTISATTVMPVTTSGYKASRTVFARLQNATPTEEAETAVRLSWSNPDSLHHILVFKNDQAYSYASNGGNLPSNFTIDVKTVEAYDVPYSRFRYSGPYKVILYTVNDEYAKILTSNTNTSSQQLNNPPGNIQNGYGIFTAMQADTVQLTVNN
ncbi:MAG: hypothetical protein EOP54_26915 [Sphingobacteriales bacterium]|nr:MAG: hypothetical protein EOP54_26915 [Sphingobacteriales bacterium]